MKFASIICSTGTRFRAKDAVAIKLWHQKGFVCISAGYGKNANSHAGSLIALNRIWWHKKHISSFAYTTGRIQGRGLAVRLKRGQGDWMPVAACAAPFQGQVARVTADLFDWLTRLYLRCPARLLPILAGDLNSHVGMVYTQGRWQTPGSNSIGPCGAEKENAQGKLLRNFCDKHGLAAINTGQTSGSGKSYWNSNGRATSRPSYIVVPQSKKDQFTKCTVRKNLGYRVQCSESSLQIDHSPLQAAPGLHQGGGFFGLEL